MELEAVADNERNVLGRGSRTSPVLDSKTRGQEMLVWLHEMRGPGELAAEKGGWGRVLKDAAVAGHVDMVKFCLDSGWFYSPGVMSG